MRKKSLTAWLIEQNVAEAIAYISERAYPCIELDGEEQVPVDRGMAPFMLMAGMSEVNQTLGKRDTLDGLTLGVRLTDPALKVVQQPYHAQFVLYSIPDDVAASFDCASRLSLAGKTPLVS